MAVASKRIVENTLVATLAARGWAAGGSPLAQSWATGWAARWAVAIEASSERGEGKYNYTLLAEPFNCGRGMQVWDAASPSGLLLSIKGSANPDAMPGTVHVTTGKPVEGVISAARRGARIPIAFARGYVAPGSVPAGTEGAIRPAEGVQVKVFDLGPAIRACADIRVRRERGHGDTVYFGITSAGYRVLKVNLAHLRPLTGWLDAAGLDAWASDQPVGWSRKDRHAVAQKAGVRLFTNHQVRVAGRHVCTLQPEEAALLRQLLDAPEGEYVRFCRVQKNKLANKLRGHVSIQSKRKTKKCEGGYYL